MLLNRIVRRFKRLFVGPSRQNVIDAYELLLQREPESEAVIHLYRQLPSAFDVVKNIIATPEFEKRFKNNFSDDEMNDLFKALLQREVKNSKEIKGLKNLESAKDVVISLTNSDEFTGQKMGNPFYCYNTSIDALGIIANNEDKQRKSRPNHKVNFFGVAIPNRVLPEEMLAGIADVEAAIKPANWHADIAEFAAALQSVEQASDTFTMIELGCGWGCWMSITGVAAKRQGLKTHVIGVEGDPTHIDYARETLAINEFETGEQTLHHGIAGAQKGTALFPKKAADKADWGLEPVFDPDAKKYAKLKKSGAYEELSVIGLAELTRGHKYIDLIHIDIQGGELDFVKNSIKPLSKKVKRLVIGTHSRHIEGMLVEILEKAGWILEIERPAIIGLATGKSVVIVDGVQGWYNPILKL